MMSTDQSAMGQKLANISTCLFDLDGVIWRGDTVIEGAVESVRRLQEAGKHCLYCTNNSHSTRADYVEKLRGMGIEATEDDVITSASATAHYLSAVFTGPFLAYVIGGPGIITSLQKLGARVIIGEVEDETRVDCVVVGIDRAFSYDKLRSAQRLILNGALFVATNRDTTYPTENGVVPGAGSLVASIEAASGVTPVVVGKPRPAMVQMMLDKLGVAPAQALLVGDRLDTDIVCAHRAGIAALFVATGVTPLETATRAKGEHKPDALFENLPALCDAVLGLAGDDMMAAVPLAAASPVAAVAGAAMAEATPLMQDANLVEASAAESDAVESAAAESDAVESGVTPPSVEQVPETAGGWNFDEPDAGPPATEIIAPGATVPEPSMT
ncbi:MAG TPA: phosphoglycolate/pyridoxal phosphate family phosphatase, partial [Abditibacteriaceae bacterium]|nr:phosphoglycolate/pyridoxal phosphate family phosphatase [Abditibacteriaceae bacterium]